MFFDEYKEMVYHINRYVTTINDYFIEHILQHYTRAKQDKKCDNFTIDFFFYR